jgi:hypothetical protein
MEKPFDIPPEIQNRVLNPRPKTPWAVAFFLLCAYFFELFGWQAGVLENTLACLLFEKEALGHEILTRKVVIGFSTSYSQVSLPV